MKTATLLHRLLTVSLCAIVLSSCSQDRFNSEEPAPHETQSSAQSWCEELDDQVNCLTTPSGATVAVIQSHSATPKGVVVWDPGGPGAELPQPDPGTKVRDLVPVSLSQFDVAVMIEPIWDNPEAEACATSLTVDNCNLPGNATTAQLLSEQVEALQAHHGPIAGLYLQSFGPVRWEEFLASPAGAQLSQSTWLAVESPAPRTGASAARLFEARTAHAHTLLEDQCATARCARLVEDLATNGQGDRLTADEFSLGVVAAATTENNDPFWNRLGGDLRNARLSDEVAGSLRRAARQYSQAQRTGTTLATLAKWAELCHRYTDWDLLKSSHDPLERAHAHLYAGCFQVPQGTVARVGDGHLWPHGPVMLILSDPDAVVSIEQQQTWKEAFSTAQTMQSIGHLNLDERGAQELQRWMTKNTTLKEHR